MINIDNVLTEKINHPPKYSKLRIFLSPLDWGLGHATRCIPIIKRLLTLGCDVIIGADKATYILLIKEFPNLQFVRMSGYEIKYSRKIEGFYLKMLSQLPRIITVIWKENGQLQRIIRDYQIDAVISDNRFGLFTNLVPCVYITHQLQIKTGNFFANKIATYIHRYFIQKYSHCWIPDYEKEGLAGELSHPKKLPEKAVYLGALSRFEFLGNTGNKYDILVSLSGPEPQRSIFEEKILKQCAQIEESVLLIRGLPGNPESLDHSLTNLTAVNHLSADELNQALLQSHMVIARSGYTTIMDLVKLQKKAILVPTPGQTEQEYLAQYLMKKKYFYSVTQNNFFLKDALKSAGEFNFLPFRHQEETYLNLISEFVGSIKSGNFAVQ